MSVKLLILDILKPLDISILEYAKAISKINKSYSVNLRVEEIDTKTETVEVIVQGDNISLKQIESVITRLGGSIHSIDEVAVGSRLIKSSEFVRKTEK